MEGRVMITRYILMHMTVELPSETVKIENHMMTVPFNIGKETLSKMMTVLMGSDECKDFARGATQNG
jgi:hypothetical protein